MGEVDLSLVGLEEDGGSADYAGSVPLQVDAARGVVYGEEVGRGGGGGGGGRAWHRKMSAPITSLWVQDGLRLSRVNLSSHSALPSHQRPTLMMGNMRHNSLVFVCDLSEGTFKGRIPYGT